MANYLITGGTGLIGCSLIEHLRQSPGTITVLTRNKNKALLRLGDTINAVESLSEIGADSHFDYVVNLAGEPIADKRWSDSQKRRLWHSRIELTEQLVQWIKGLKTPPKAFISGSAVGWYGDGHDLELDEHSPAHSEYTHILCDAWELAASQATEAGVRVCLVRTGLVLSPDGGLLSKMKLPFKLGMGAQLGSGKQYMSWIHIEDMVRALEFLIGEGQTDTNTRNGVFNLTSPEPVTNGDFTMALAQQLNRRAFLAIPSRLLSLMLGEMARLLITGQRVLPSRLIELGFTFHYPSLAKALENVLHPKPQ